MKLSRKVSSLIARVRRDKRERNNGSLSRQKLRTQRAIAEESRKKSGRFIPTGSPSRNCNIQPPSGTADVPPEVKGGVISMAQGGVCSPIPTKIQDENTPATETRSSSPPNDYATEDDPDNDQTEQDDDSETEEESDEGFLEDMRKLERDFKDISREYRLISKIGEGTFSTVYKAEQLTDDNNEASRSRGNGDEPTKRPTSQIKSRRKANYVALKKIYVTSSPQRILNELEILYALRDSKYICPLLTAFRHQDQVVAVLPYFRHLDFRLYYRHFIVSDMRHYFHSLLSALQAVHRAGIIHRDIKPTNFLYDHTKRHGVLVDFGLAEKQGTDWQPCLCLESRSVQKRRYVSSLAFTTLHNSNTGQSTGYPKNDQRPSRRANRAGTRGFRAPEVLLKCTAQSTKIDIWSTGVILLTLLARRFPFFNSTDDVDAMIELTSLLGRRKMKQAAAMHGLVFESNIETISEHGFTFEKVIIWAAVRGEDQPLSSAEKQAISLLEGLLEVDPQKRSSARQALQHEFFTDPQPDAPLPDEDEDEEEDDDAMEGVDD